MLDIPLILALVSFGVSVALTFKYRRTHHLRLPPGPKPLLIFGNALDIPFSKQWLTFEKWAREYGEIVHVSLFGQSVILLNSAKAISDLLEKRSALYSDRLKSTVVSMIGWDWNVALMGYGPRWRQTRRIFHEHFHQGAARQYRPMQLAGARRFLARLLADPDSFVRHLRHDLGATILEVSYGIQARDIDDQYLEIGERAVAGPTESLVLGALWVEFLPMLRYLPTWVPGASYQRKAKKWYAEAMALKHEPFAKAMEDLRDGTGIWSLASELMTRDSGMEKATSAEKEELAKNVAAVTYGAGADTSYSTLQTFFLAMALHPEVQRKAQAELDAVVGFNRLPEYEDQSKLVYIHAILKECLRWQNVFTLGLPHRLMEEDEYNGYYIPKGSIVLGNVWAICHDPEMYPNPQAFNPDRYFKPNGTQDSSVFDPALIAFGFGRRVCPGRHFAMASLFIYAASILQVFNIHKKKGDSRTPEQLMPELVSGVVTFPSKFECDIIPRSEEAAELVRNSGE